MVSDFRPDDIYRQLTQFGEAWADAHAAADMLSETKKTVLAKLIAEAPQGSMAAKENHALTQPEYHRHVEATVSAVKAANKAKVRYDSAKVLAELKRTQAANERAANRHAT